MSNLSDTIEYLLKQMLADNEGRIEFTRNDLAERLNCVPSQISYVLQTRFTNGMGYIKESRRGGGGSIRIYQVDFDSAKEHLVHQIQSLPESLSQQESHLIIDNLEQQQALSKAYSKIAKAAVSKQALVDVPVAELGKVRSAILSNILLTILRLEERSEE